MSRPYKTAIAVITDGRANYCERAIRSAQTSLRSDFTYPIIIDDSADTAHREWLDQNFGSRFQIVHHEERRGLGAAVRSAWESTLTTDADYLLHLEEDFVFDVRIDLNDWIRILHCESQLAQLLIKRAPWGWEIPRSWMECAGLEHYTDRSCPAGNWVESQKLFSFNPGIIPRRALEYAINHCTENMLEQHVTDVLLDNGYKFGCYGTIADAPLCTHIGDQRSANYKW